MEVSIFFDTFTQKHKKPNLTKKVIITHNKDYKDKNSIYLINNELINMFLNYNPR